MTLLLLESIAENANYADLPEVWRIPELDHFSREKTLYDYQKAQSEVDFLSALVSGSPRAAPADALFSRNKKPAHFLRCAGFFMEISQYRTGNAPNNAW